MNGKLMLYVDQWGQRYYAYDRKHLARLVRIKNGVGGRISKMYIDTHTGKTLHVGYVVGKWWLTAYMPYEREVMR